jgi:hypothetical protein
VNGFLGEIGKKLAERWITLLAIPGLLFIAAATAAAVLGQSNALDYASLSRHITQWANSTALRSIGGTVLIVVAVLVGSVLAGLAASALGRVIQLVWVMPGKHPPAKWLADWRRRRSRDAKGVADDPSASQAQVLKAITKANRICLIEANRPTWIGDRLRACQVRVDRTYGLDLNAAWPRLWLTVSEVVRDEISAARDAFSASARLEAWAVLYLPLAIWWWPGAVIALVAAMAAILKARLATSNLADLIESAVDLYGRELATQLGHSGTGPMTATLGKELTIQMRKDRWDPRSTLAD